MEKIIRVGDVNIACKDHIPETTASPLPIIFLHDSLGCISVWKDFPDTVAESVQLRCVVYDREGYGKSGPFSNPERDTNYLELQADFLIRFLDVMDIDRCILFGHSDGGSIALIAAAKYPDRIEAIITEGAHVFVEEVTLAGIRKAKQAFTDTDLRSRLVRHHGEKVDVLFDAWTETWLSPGFRDWNIERFLEQVICPVLTIYGKNDEYGTLLQAESIAQHVRGYSEQYIIPGIGHTPHKEASSETLAAVIKFIRKFISGGLR